MKPHTIRRVLIVMLVAVLLYFGFALYSGIEKVGKTLASFQWWAFAAACGLAFGNYVLRWLKWEFYLARLGIRGVSKSDSFLTFLSGFILTVTPGKVGEVFKSVVFFETHGVPVARTAPIVVAERVTDLIGIIVLIVVGSLGFSGGLVWAAAGATVVAALLLVIASRKLSHGIIGLLQKLPGPFKKIGPKLHEAYDSLAELVKPSNLIFPTLVSIAAWLLECLALWIIVRGFGAALPIMPACFIYATSTLAGALIPVPGGLGITETSLKEQLFALGGIEDATTTAIMFLVRFATLWFAVIVGFCALSLLKRRYPTLLAAKPKGATGDVAPGA